MHKFDTEGPGSVGDNLDAGLKLMEEYGGMFAELEQRRLDLMNAEMLFDIPLADYTDYLRAKADYEGMEFLYRIYKTQRNAREVSYFLKTQRKLTSCNRFGAKPYG